LANTSVSKSVVVVLVPDSLPNGEGEGVRYSRIQKAIMGYTACMRIPSANWKWHGGSQGGARSI